VPALRPLTAAAAGIAVVAVVGSLTWWAATATAAPGDPGVRIQAPPDTGRNDNPDNNQEDVPDNPDSPESNDNDVPGGMDFPQGEETIPGGQDQQPPLEDVPPGFPAPPDSNAADSAGW
jgi:hypothetical protein